MSETSPPRAWPHVDVGGYLLGTLDDAEVGAVERHLAGCPECSAEVAELRQTAAALASAGYVDDDEPPAGLRQRTLAAVAGVASAGRPARPARWRVAAVAAAAAVVVGGGAVGGLAAAGAFGHSTSVTTVALVAAPGTRATGTGEARISRTGDGLRVVLSVRQLAPNPPGTFYECWFVGPGDTLARPNRVSAGTFTVGPSRSATVTMVTAADRLRFPVMGVTLEPNDGNPARTGPKVLVTKSR